MTCNTCGTASLTTLSRWKHAHGLRSQPCDMHVTYLPPPQCAVDDPALQVPPFRLTFPPVNPNKRPHPPVEREGEEEGCDGRSQEKTVVVTPYSIPNRGPYPLDQPKRWVVRVRVPVCQRALLMCRGWTEGEGVLTDLLSPMPAGTLSGSHRPRWRRSTRGCSPD